MLFSNRKNNPASSAENSADQTLLTNLTKHKWPNWSQFKALPKLLSGSEKVQLKIFSLLGIIAAVALLIIFYLSHSQIVPKMGGEYTEGLVGAPQYLNPLLLSGNSIDEDIAPLIFDGLFKINNDNQIEPNLTESLTLNEDKKSSLLHLRKNVLWHDGKPFTADDVMFTLQATQGPDWPSPLKNNLKDLNFEKVDDYTIKINSAESVDNLMEKLTFGIIPQHLWLTVNPASLLLTELNRKPIGTGPFKFETLTKDKNGLTKNIVLARNNNYHLAKPYLDRITFKFYTDWETAVAALKNQNVEGLSLIPDEQQKAIENNKNVRLYSLSLPQYTAVFFNSKQNSLLKDKKFRRALTLAIDKEKIIQEVLDQKALAINSPILPGSFGFAANLQPYKFDPEQATTIFKSLGWSKNASGTLAKNKTLAELTLTTSDKTEYQKTAEIIKNNWEQLGLKVNLKIVSKDQIINNIIAPRNYEMILFGELIKSDPLPFWHSSFSKDPGRNLTDWQNKEADALLEKLHAQPNDPNNKNNYRRFQEIILDEAPAIFLYNPIQTYPLSTKIQGFVTRRIASAADRFNLITDWYTKTTRKFSWSKK